MKKVLFHICCGPCFIAPYKLMLSEGEIDVQGYWYNDNIHPYKEYEARLTTVQQWAQKAEIPLIIEDSYNLKQFLRRSSNREDERCYFCYYIRLFKTAAMAHELKCDGFSTGLLYSIYQQHSLIKMLGEEIASKTGVDFYYRDFRPLWREGIEMSKKSDMYRQKYCGCIFSEEERYRR